jgi:hypothetical protein
LSSRQAQKEAARRQRLERERAARARERRSRRLRLAGGVVSAALLAGAGIVVAGTGHPSAGGLSAPAIDAIRCEASEQVLFHVHSHLSIVADGRQVTVPEGIGIAPPRGVQQTSDGPFVVNGSCFYWLHTHARDGIIHIESPVQRTYTLGEFFDIWNQPLGRTRVATARGPVTAFVDGRRFTGDPRAIALGNHRVVQLDVGRVVAPAGFSFPAGL